jgi:hypothetical protein
MGAKRLARRESRRRNSRIPPSCAPAWRHGQGQALRVLRNLDAAGRGRTAGTRKSFASVRPASISNSSPPPISPAAPRFRRPRMMRPTPRPSSRSTGKPMRRSAPRPLRASGQPQSFPEMEITRRSSRSAPPTATSAPPSPARKPTSTSASRPRQRDRNEPSPDRHEHRGNRHHRLRRHRQPRPHFHLNEKRYHRGSSLNRPLGRRFNIRHLHALEYPRLARAQDQSPPHKEAGVMSRCTNIVRRTNIC